MLDRKRCEMCVGNQVRTHGCLRQEAPQHLSVSLGRRWNPHSIAVEPLFDLLPCGADRGRPLEDTRIGHQAEEREQARPGQPDPRGAVEALVEPGPGALVLGEVVDVGVDEKVRVDKDQWKRSPSATASASATSSTLSSRQRPRDTAFVA